MRLKIPLREVEILLDAPKPTEYPKYAPQIINLANQNAQGTRPKIVGQQTELIQQFSGTTLAEWELWYQDQYPDAIQMLPTKFSQWYRRCRARQCRLIGRWSRHGYVN